MTTNSEAPVPPRDPSRETPPVVAPVPARRGNGLAALALLTALAGIGLQFHPYILGRIEQLAGPQPWIDRIEQFLLHRQPQPDAAPVVALAGHSLAVSSAAAEHAVELDALRASLADVRQTVERLEAKLPEAGQTDAVADVRAQLDALTQRQVTLEKELAQQLQQVETRLGKYDQRLAVASPPQTPALLVARIALVTVNRSLTASDVEQLAAVAALDPALSEAVATLKVLVDQDIPSPAALRDQFEANREPALAAARSTQLRWWEAGISSARATMSDWGLARPMQESKDDLIVSEAQRRLDLGDIRGALFQFEAASPELKDAFALWLDQAHLRLTLDDALLELVDAMIKRDGGPHLQPRSSG